MSQDTNNLPKLDKIERGFVAVAMAPLPHLLEDVLPALHEAHEDVEGGEDGRADQELVQQHLLRDGRRRLAHEPGPMRARRVVT